MTAAPARRADAPTVPATMPAHSGTGRTGSFSKRQAEVLSAVLALMVRDGDRFSMADVAQAASCSKETLYRWFGDREGLLTATVQWQAAKVVMPELKRDTITPASLHTGLAAFAESWLGVITGDVSLALNRLAMSHAGTASSAPGLGTGLGTGLGHIVLAQGPLAMAGRVAAMLELGRAAGLLMVPDIEAASSVFFGLVIQDSQIRCLLGEPDRPDPTRIKVRAEAAATHFLVLFGTDRQAATQPH